MPKKDHITGVMVMTTAEFFAKEAEIHGTTPAKEFETFLTDWQTIMEEDRQRYFDIAVSGPLICDWIKQNNEGCTDCPDEMVELPAEILEITDVKYSASFREHTLQITTKARKTDGSTGTLQYNSWYYSGNRLNPPEEDMSAEWVNNANTA